ncbi:MAG: PilN domain-containing protein [Desulfovibrionales bacterium]
MIRINLLPKQKRVSVSNVEKEVVLYFLLVVLMIVGAFSVNVWVTQQVDVLRAEVSQKQSLRNTLKIKVNKVNQIKKELADIQRKIQIIKQVRDKQGLPIRYVDEVVRNLPADRIWFESFQMNDNGSISIRGVSADNQVFAQYVQNLRSSPFISSVVTQRTSRREIQGLGLVEFSCNIVAKPTSEQNNG